MTSSLAPSMARRIVGRTRRLGGVTSASIATLTPRQTDDADRLAFLDWRAHRAVVDDARDQLSLPFFGTITLIGSLLANFTERLSPPGTGVADLLVLGEQRPRLECEAPFQHFLGFLGAIIRVVEAIDDHDQADAVLQPTRPCRNRRPWCSRSSIRQRRSSRIQQRIAVLLPDLVQVNSLLAEQFVELGKSG